MKNELAYSAVRAIEDVEARWQRVPFMKLSQARFLRKFIREHDLADVLELGFFHGKSTAFIAAILEELGRGHVTTCDKRNALERSPNIHEVLESLGLEHRVTVQVAHRSFTWEMARMLESRPRPTFDFCYIDGAHTWDGTGFSFFLVDLMLRPGGWIIFDDLDWTIAGREAKVGPRFEYRAYSDEEKEAKQVRKVFEVLAVERGYTDMYEHERFRWGVARKPLK
jgi:predicted O-methyltransferase YrrM